MLLIHGAVDRRIADRMECCGYLILHISIGTVFACFGALTLFGLIGLIYRQLLWAALLCAFCRCPIPRCRWYSCLRSALRYFSMDCLSKVSTLYETQF